MKTNLSQLEPPPSHLRDALIKEEDENSNDNLEKPPKRRKIKHEIIKPDPKYKGKKTVFFVIPIVEWDGN